MENIDVLYTKIHFDPSACFDLYLFVKFDENVLSYTNLRGLVKKSRGFMRVSDICRSSKRTKERFVYLAFGVDVFPALFAPCLTAYPASGIAAALAEIAIRAGVLFQDCFLLPVFIHNSVYWNLSCAGKHKGLKYVAFFFLLSGGIDSEVQNLLHL